MNRRKFLGILAGAALAGQAQAAPLYREPSARGRQLLSQRDSIADGLNAIVAGGGDPTTSAYAAGVAEMRRLEREFISLEN